MKKITFNLVFIICFCIAGNAQWVTISYSAAGGKYDALHFIDSQKGYCSGAGQRATIDGGSTWTSSSSQGFRDFGFYDNTYGYGAGVVGQSMAKTVNGGTSWTSITPPTSNSLWAVSATSPTTAYFVGTGGVLWKTANSGATVTVLNSGTTNLLTDIIFTDATTGYLVVQNGQVKKTTSSGTSWTVVNTLTGKLLTEMDFPDANTGYVVGSAGTISKTSDAGASWTTLVTNSTSYLQGVNFFDANHGIVVGTGGTILYTNNGGTTWDLQNSGTTENLYDVRMLSATSAVVVGDKSTILKNTNIVVGIENNTLSKGITLYPNPVVNELIVKTTNSVNAIEIFDALGKRVYSSNVITANEHSIDFSTMTPGIYTVSVNSSKGNLIQKVVK